MQGVMAQSSSYTNRPRKIQMTGQQCTVLLLGQGLKAGRVSSLQPYLQG
jgi:hypothetical protein